jgi:hypothetical protein
MLSSEVFYSTKITGGKQGIMLGGYVRQLLNLDENKRR